MNARTERQITEMKNQTIGGRGRDEQHQEEQGSEDCRRLLRNRQIRKHGKPQRLLHLVGMGRRRTRVEIQRDVSISGPDDEKCEMVTPILHYSDIETLQELCRQLRHAGSKERRQPGMRSPHSHQGRTATRRRRSATLPTSWQATRN